MKTEYQPTGKITISRFLTASLVIFITIACGLGTVPQDKSISTQSPDKSIAGTPTLVATLTEEREDKIGVWKSIDPEEGRGSGTPEDSRAGSLLRFCKFWSN